MSTNFLGVMSDMLQLVVTQLSKPQIYGEPLNNYQVGKADPVPACFRLDSDEPF